jgi:hypothetical protein
MILLNISRMTNRYIPSVCNLAVQAIWYGVFFFLISKIYANVSYTVQRAIRRKLGRRYLLCVINSSHNFRLTVSKPCTVDIDKLKMCM